MPKARSVKPAPSPITPNRAQRRHPDKVWSPARRQFITIAQAAEYLNVCQRTVRLMIADGRLVGYRLNDRFIRLDRNEIDEAMRPFGGSVTNGNGNGNGNEAK